MKKQFFTHMCLLPTSLSGKATRWLSSERRGFTIRLMLTVLMLVTSVEAWAIGGSGTSSDPYTIANASDWSTFCDNFSSYTDKYIKLTGSFSTSTVVTSDLIFTGNFDGNNQTITLNYTLTDTATGLFRYVDAVESVIMNLNVAGTITASQDCMPSVDGIGAIVGKLGQGTVQNCTSSVTINDNGNTLGHVGGIVGAMYDATVRNCSFTGTLSCGNSDDAIGGIVGYARSNKRFVIINCLSTGSISVSSSTKAGAILGYVLNDDNTKNSRNNYWKDNGVNQTNGGYGSIGGASKSDSELKSGQIARLLNGGNGSTERADGSWGNTVGSNYPSLGGEKVYRVTLYPNGGLEQSRFAYTNASPLPSNPFTAPIGLFFKGWSTSLNGSLVYSVSSDCELFAIWDGLHINGLRYAIYFDNYTVKVIGSQSNDITSVVIPETIEYNGERFKVTSIGESAFSGFSGLTSITIPSSVTSIGQSAFGGCTGLQKVIVKDIASWCNISFGDFDANPLYKAQHIYSDETTEITNLVIPEGVTSIGFAAFRDGFGLTSVTIPNSVKNIGNAAFRGCIGLTSITIPDSVTYISDQTFYDCWGLTSVTIPNSVTSVGNNAFYNCKSITALDLNCENVGNWFGDSKTKITTVTLGEKVKSIGESAFSGFTGLTSINIPNSVTSIGESAFYGCTGLTSINIPEGVTSIGESAFYGCTGLTSVTIPNSVTSIGPGVFRGCTGLTSINIPNSVTSIKGSAFRGCTGLTSINIPEGVTSIGWSAFSGCSGLTSITIPSSVTSVDNDAFSGCTNIKALDLQCKNVRNWFGDSKESITSVVLGDSVKSIGDYAFSRCSSLTNIEIPASVTSIGASAFYNCTGLTSINIPEGVTSVISNAFQGCTNITALDLQCQNVGNWFGDSKESITSVSLGKGVKSITSDAFSGFSNLSKVSIDDIAAWCAIDFGNADANPLKQSKHLFRKNREITELGIPSDVEAIKQYAFYGCEGLTSVSIPSSVKSIGSYAFADCINLTSVVSEIGIPFKLDETAFTYTDTSYPDNIIYMLATLYVPAGRDALYKQIDGWKNFTNIMVVQAVESVSLSETSVILEEIGATCQLQATVLPDDANNKTVTWTSSDEAVCTVSETGLVTATGVGSASVTVTTVDGEKTATCEVTVVIPVKSIALDVEKLQLTVGETGQIVATVQPDNATDKSVEWTSSDDAVATVDENGMIAAIKEGTAYITVKSVSYPEVMAVCEVTVVEDDGIFAIEMGGAQQVRAIYDVSGRKVETLQKGLNIVVLRDGTIKRVFIK